MSGGEDSMVARLDALRQGDRGAVENALERYAPWLRLLARHEVESRFRARFDPSDVVQYAMLEAVRSFESFEGRTDAELTAWLRKILARALSHEVRRHKGAQKRDVGREQSLERDLEEVSGRWNAALAARDASPSMEAVQKESSLELAAALERLPDDYREVVILRNLEGLEHEEVARRMGRSSGAVRMLWVRALVELRNELGTDEAGA